MNAFRFITARTSVQKLSRQLILFFFFCYFFLLLCSIRLRAGGDCESADMVIADPKRVKAASDSFRAMTSLGDKEPDLVQVTTFSLSFVMRMLSQLVCNIFVLFVWFDVIESVCTVLFWIYFVCVIYQIVHWALSLLTFHSYLYCWLYQACMRPCPSDGLPVMGVVPRVEGAYISCGHNCWGILWAPASGLAMAELIATGESSTIDLKSFSPERFDRSGRSARRGKKMGTVEVGEQWWRRRWRRQSKKKQDMTWHTWTKRSWWRTYKKCKSGEESSETKMSRSEQHWTGQSVHLQCDNVRILDLRFRHVNSLLYKYMCFCYL